MVAIEPSAKADEQDEENRAVPLPDIKLRTPPEEVASDVDRVFETVLLQKGEGLAIPDVLCKSCSSLIQNSKLLALDLKTHRSILFDDRENHYIPNGFVETGFCHLCALIRPVLGDRSPQYARARVEIRASCGSDWSCIYLLATELDKDGQQLACCLLNIDAIDDAWAKLDVFTASGKPPNVPENHSVSPHLRTGPSRAALARHSGADSVFELASSWISDCVKGHVACNRDTDHSFLPTRLMEIDWPNHTARLVSTSDLGVKMPYTTLSHCWGGRDVTRLTTKSLANLQKGILVDDLPDTFREAMCVTWNLGYQHIWIDSLCIIQDSADDWTQESTSMCEVYKHSVCTIAALASENSYEGLFRERNPLSYVTCRIPHPKIPNLSYKVYSDPGWRYGTLEKKTPLHERGWVLQERLLSRRVLNFGPTLVSWECFESETNELEHFEFREIWEGRKNKRLKVEFHELCSGKNGILEDISYAKWDRIRKAYTACNLTFHTDKLIAFSGIVQEVQRHTGMEPVAGLWRQLLRRELLWRVSSSGTRYEEQSYYAPSWSWASIVGSVEHIPLPNMSSEGDSVKWLADIEDIQLTPKQMNKHGGSGELVDGWLEINGELCTVDARATFWQDIQWEDTSRSKFLPLIRHTTSTLSTATYFNPDLIRIVGLLLAPASSADCAQADRLTSHPGRRIYKRTGLFECFADGVTMSDESLRLIIV